jgi:hypothetical protein
MTLFVENGPPAAEIDHAVSARLNQSQYGGGNWHTNTWQRVQ